MKEPKFPDVTVKLEGEDGNAGSIMGRVVRAIKAAGASKEEVDEYRKESMSGDYNTLLMTVMKWVNVE